MTLDQKIIKIKVEPAEGNTEYKDPISEEYKIHSQNLSASRSARFKGGR